MEDCRLEVTCKDVNERRVVVVVCLHRILVTRNVPGSV